MRFVLPLYYSVAKFFKVLNRLQKPYSSKVFSFIFIRRSFIGFARVIAAISETAFHSLYYSKSFSATKHYAYFGFCK